MAVLSQARQQPNPQFCCTVPAPAAHLPEGLQLLLWRTAATTAAGAGAGCTLPRLPFRLPLLVPFGEHILDPLAVLRHRRGEELRSTYDDMSQHIGQLSTKQPRPCCLAQSHEQGAAAPMHALMVWLPASVL